MYLFDEAYYLTENSDVRQAVESGQISAYDHFASYGRYEGRKSSPWFDPAEYLEMYPDVRAAVEQGLVTAYDHYVYTGIYEGRKPFANAGVLDTNGSFPGADDSSAWPAWEEIQWPEISSPLEEMLVEPIPRIEGLGAGLQGESSVYAGTPWGEASVSQQIIVASGGAIEIMSIQGGTVSTEYYFG